MNRLFFMGMFILFFFFIDYYFFQAVKIGIKSWTPENQKIASIIYWAIPVLSLGASIFAFVLFPQYLPSKYRNLVAAGIFIFYISKILGSVFLIIDDVTRFFRYAGKKIIPSENNQEPITRTEFLAKTALAVGGAHVGLMAYGIISGAYDYRIRRKTLFLKNLPKAFEGMTLAQISDIHTGSFFNKTAVQGGVDMLLGQKPDIVFFTGDLVNNEAKELNDYFDVFKKVKAPLGVFSTLGNHDYGDYIQWDSKEEKNRNLATLQEGHKLLGWDLLMDEHRAITVNGESLAVLGIQNWGLGGFVKKGDLRKALAGTEQFDTKLLLSHDPSHWRAQVLGKTNIDAAFAGHTHGMQYGIEIGDFKWSPSQYRYKEWAGLYQEDEQQLYINRGYGFLGYPGRVGILPEISIFELKRG